MKKLPQRLSQSQGHHHTPNSRDQLALGKNSKSCLLLRLCPTCGLARGFHGCLGPSFHPQNGLGIECMHRFNFASSSVRLSLRGVKKRLALIDTAVTGFELLSFAENGRWTEVQRQPRKKLSSSVLSDQEATFYFRLPSVCYVVASLERPVKNK